MRYCNQNYAFKIILIVLIFIGVQSKAQAPLGFNYQGVALTNAGTPVASKKISLRVSLIESTQLGTLKYQETHNVNTDSYGQFSVIIGNGQIVSGKMSDLQWNQYPYYLKVELDLEGGTSFVYVGTSQLLSVPYALYANNAGAASIGVDSLKNILNTISLSQKGDSIILNNNRGSIYIPKIDSLSKIINQFVNIKAGTIKYVKDSVTKTPVGLAIGFNALNAFDSSATNSANIAIGQNAGFLLPKYSDVYNNNDNVFVGNASGWGIGSSTGGGANQNVMLGNYTGQYMNGRASSNIIIGHEAGRFSNGTIGTQTPVFNQNIAIGGRSMQYAVIAQSNVALGNENFNRSKQVNRNVTIGNNMAPDYNGDDNVLIGTQMLIDTSSNGSKNVIIGSTVASNIRGSGNIVLGYNAASDTSFRNLNNKLIISNTKTANPLILGEFDNKKITINGDLNVTGKINVSNSNSIFNYSDTLGNFFIGKNALKSNTTGWSNLAIGENALTRNTTSDRNLAIGQESLSHNTIGGYNIGVGTYSLFNNLNGQRNVAVGMNSLISNTSGNNNTSLGFYSLSGNTTGGGNVAIGSNSLYKNKTGINNIGIGSDVIIADSSGSNNIGIGVNAGGKLLSGDNNIFLGSNAGFNSQFVNSSNKLVIQNDTSISPLIFGEFDNKKLKINGDLSVTGTTYISGNISVDSTIKSLNKKIDSLVAAMSARIYGKIDSSSLATMNPVIATKFLDSTFLPTINFDGSKSFVQIGSTNISSLLNGKNFTIEGWIKNYKTDKVQTIISSGGDNNGWTNYLISVLNGRLTVSFVNGSNFLISSDMPTDSLWHHFSFVSENNKYSAIYIDGIEKNRANNTGINIFTSLHTGIGAFIDGYTGAPTSFYNGSIRKLRISKGKVYSSNYTPSFSYTKADSTIAFWELNDLGTHIKANDSAYNGTLYNGTWLVPDTTSVRLSDGLLAHYPFNGNVNDSSGNAKNGTLNGASFVSDRFGKTNAAIDLDGISNYVSLPLLSSLNGLSKASFSFWIKNPTSNAGAIIGHNGNNNGGVGVNTGLTIGQYQGGIEVGNYSGCCTSISNKITDLTKWSNVIVLFDGTLLNSERVKIYLDGVLSNGTIGTTNTTIGNATSSNIGRRNIDFDRFGDYFKGQLDDIRIYNRKLNVNEISYLSSETSAPSTLKTGDTYGGGLVAYIYQPTDSGYVAGQVHGIIAAPTDQGTASWGCEGSLIGTQNGLGKGKFNTEQIISKCNDTATAAKICRVLNLNGYTDWYFPSLDEMKQLRFYLHLKGLGNFRTDLSYFASTETSASTAYEFYISSGAAGGINKQGNKMAVRAIRYF